MEAVDHQIGLLRGIRRGDSGSPAVIHRKHSYTHSPVDARQDTAQVRQRHAPLGDRAAREFAGKPGCGLGGAF
jgi:hypothetical protein